MARPTRRPGLVLGVVAFSVFVAADDLTVVSTMLRPIINDLGFVLPDGLGDAAWVVNAYLIAFVAVMPIAGKLSDVVGRRKSFAAAWVVFAAGSALVPLSVHLGEPFRWFLVGRILTALGGGAMVPIALAVVGDAFPPGRRTRALGVLGGIETLGWVWGPLYGALLVRVATWQWQFWLNLPLAAIGLVVSWRVLDGVDDDRPPARVDWIGAGLLTTALVSINVALLGGATVQSVTGLDELTGTRSSTAWAYPVAALAGLGYLWWQRTTRSPLINPRLLTGRGVTAALIVNLVVGAGLVIAMVDVPIFVNAVVLDVARAATTAGWVLSALTATMAVSSWVGGRLGERFSGTAFVGLAVAIGAFVWMGVTWSATIGWASVAIQLGVLGVGIGLTVAPSTAAVVDAAPASDRGAAAAVVMLARLMGLSIGLSALTAWALRRFDAARRTVELPPLGSDGYEAAVVKAQTTLTATAVAETFLAAAAVIAVGAVAAILMRRAGRSAIENSSPPITTTTSAARSTAMTTPETGDVAATSGGELAALRRQMYRLTGVLASLLVVTLVVVAVLVGRVQRAGADAASARERAERAESGAALYASQIDGFQQQLTDLQPELDAQLGTAIDGLRGFEDSTITFPVTIDETVPIETEVRINRTIEVPIKLDVPIDETFDTTIQIDTPLGKVPLDVSVPVKVTVPIDETVAIPIDETLPISQDVPIQLEVPVEIDVGETELSTLVASIASGLESLRGMLTGLASPAESDDDTDG